MLGRYGDNSKRQSSRFQFFVCIKHFLFHFDFFISIKGTFSCKWKIRSLVLLLSRESKSRLSAPVAKWEKGEWLVGRELWSEIEIRYPTSTEAGGRSEEGGVSESHANGGLAVPSLRKLRQKQCRLLYVYRCMCVVLYIYIYISKSWYTVTSSIVIYMLH